MWKSDDIIRTTTGVMHAAPFEASCVAIDSRTLQPGALFIALKGDRVDGHDYVKDALLKGAAGAMVHHMPPGITKDAKLIVVNDTYKALVDMAIAARRRTSAKVIAITGSVGKTGAKEALRTVLASSGSVFGTEGNLNNHIGLPLSLVNLPPDARFGVFELGMNHAGELSFLTRIVKPDLAIITNVEAVHLEFFPDIEAIADAKAEIMEGMAASGTIILNRDNRFYDRLLGHAEERGIPHVITFGEHEEADCRLIHYATADSGSKVEAVICGTPVIYHLGTVGRHWATLSLAALGAATALGADLANAAAALAHFHEPDGRGRIHRLARGKGAVILIDDSYNASPSSVNAALVKLVELHTGLTGRGRKIAVLGDMLELGSGAADLHKELLAALTQQQIDKVYTTGPLMKQLYDILPSRMQGAHATNATLLASIVRGAFAENDVVLIKGSHGARMDIVRDALLAPLYRNTREPADAV